MTELKPCIGCAYYNAHKPCKWCLPYEKWKMKVEEE